ncbi:MAG TPA: hypothetical protein VN737_14400 [Bryobacteraceae bacterium]|nr:hypothetical protein [Bryobacteraceae bacterium]
MNRICWSLVDVLSRTLDPDERAAVLGDFSESREAAPQALRNLLGLVVRRQAALWKDWRPWLALVGVVGILGPKLLYISGTLLFPVYMDLRAYRQYGVLYGTGLTAYEETVLFVCQGLALVVWSWAGGFVLGSLSRRTIWITGSLYFLFGLLPFLLLFRSLILFSQQFVGLLYRGQGSILLLLALLTVLASALLLVSAISGVRQGVRRLALTLPQAGALTIVTLALIAAATWTGGWPHAAVIRWSGGAWDPSAGWQNRLFAFAVVSWPAGYLLATAILRRDTATAPTRSV